MSIEAMNMYDLYLVVMSDYLDQGNEYVAYT